MPQLFTQAAIKRLSEFRNKSIQSPHSNATVSVIRREVGFLLNDMLRDDKNNLEYWYANFKPYLERIFGGDINFPEISRHLDDDPDYCNELFNLLVGIKKKWETYIPVGTRAILYFQNMKERLEQVIKYMATAKDLYERRAHTITEKQRNEIINSAVFSDVNSRVGFIDRTFGVGENQETSLDSKTIQIAITQMFQPVYEKINALPITQELREVRYLNEREFLFGYDSGVNGSSGDPYKPKPTRLTFLSEIIALEKELNEKAIELELISDETSPNFSYVTNEILKLSSAEKISQFETELAYACQILDRNLKGYCETNPDKNKLHLVECLRYLLQCVNSKDSDRQCTQVRYYLQHFQLMHCALIIKNSSLKAGELDKILDEAVSAFSKLESQITVGNNRALVEKACENRALIERATSPLYKFEVSV